MEHNSSLSPTPSDWNAFFKHLRQRAHQQLLGRQVAYYLKDALESAVSDGLLIFQQKLACADIQVQCPEAFAFEIVKRTYWDYRRRAQSKQRVQFDQLEVLQELSQKQRFADGEQLFANLSEPHLWKWYKHLSARDQKMIDLRCQGYYDHEIAVQIGLSHGGVRNCFSKLLSAARLIAQSA